MSAAAGVRPLRIGIDVRTALAPKTGDRTYCLNLVRALAELDHENEYLLLADAAPPDGLLPAQSNVRLVVLPVRPAWRFTPLALPLCALRERLDLLHVQYLIPPVCPCPVITTIHDVTFALFPHWFPPKHRWLLRALIPLAVRRSARILTGSVRTRDDLARCYAPLTDVAVKTAVTPYAPDPSLGPADDEAIASVRQRHGLTRPFILAVGVLQPRKNFAALAAAFDEVVSRHPQLPHELCVIGKSGWGEAPRGARVRRLGYVPDDELPALYSACDLFVYPSYYEGFGFPPLEAMACGAPVACSTGGSLPEAVGEAALTFDPHDFEAMVDAIARPLTDAVLRAALRARGLAHAATFSWRRTADQTLAVYREVACHE